MSGCKSTLQHIIVLLRTLQSQSIKRKTCDLDHYRFARWIIFPHAAHLHESTSMPMQQPDVRIVATGLFTPPQSISNDELVTAFNAYVDKYNAENAAEIDAGRLQQLQKSSSEFIEKASGIKSRYVIDKQGILDINRMAPRINARPNKELSVLAEIAVNAARDAMRSADLKAEDIDGVICAASNMQRGYPAMAVEIQDALGVDGYGFDINVACASAAFGIETGLGLIRAGANRILMVNPEICTAHLNFRDRDSHFIFGDVATAR